MRNGHDGAEASGETWPVVGEGRARASEGLTAPCCRTAQVTSARFERLTGASAVRIRRVNTADQKKSKHFQSLAWIKLAERGDSNPRYGCPYGAFRVRCI